MCLINDFIYISSYGMSKKVQLLNKNQSTSTIVYYEKFFIKIKLKIKT